MIRVSQTAGQVRQLRFPGPAATISGAGSFSDGCGEALRGRDRSADDCRRRPSGRRV